MKYKIGELAKLAGCQVVTIRYYEKEGLLNKPERSGGNYRLYSQDDLERLIFIRHCRRHDMKISEIRELLAFKDNPTADCSWISGMINEHVDKISEQIKSLSQLRSQLQQLQKKCKGEHGGCGIVESLSHADACPFCEDFRCQSKLHT